MAYQPNIPLSIDRISVSQGDLQGNFQEVNYAWNLNHRPFNLADEGSHWYISMPNQTVTHAVFPPATQGVFANSIGLYASGGNLWFRPIGQAIGIATSDVQLTMPAVTGITNSVTLPNGLIMKWGTGTVTQPPTPNAGFIYFPVQFPHKCLWASVCNRSILPNVYKNIVNVVAPLTPGDLTSDVRFQCQAFDYNGALAQANIYWQAFGW
jgi:hypothetical protein